MNYEVVYNVATIPFRYPRDALFGLLPVAIGLVMTIAPKLWTEARSGFIRLLGITATAFGAFLLLGVPAQQRAAYEELRAGLERGTYTLTEGVISDFTPGKPDGHPMERFVVAGREFRYSPYTSIGFNRIGAVGGPIRLGRQVRIADVNGVIARLEVAR